MLAFLSLEAKFASIDTRISQGLASKNVSQDVLTIPSFTAPSVVAGHSEPTLDRAPYVPYAGGFGYNLGGPAATVSPSGISLSRLLFDDLLDRIRELETAYGFVPDFFLSLLHGVVIHAADHSFAVYGDSIADSIVSYRSRLCDPLSPIPASSRNGDSVIPHLCSLLGVTTLSPASLAGASDALPLLDTGSMGIAGSFSSSFRHSVPFSSSAAFASPSFPRVFPSSVAFAPVDHSTVLSSGWPWLSSLPLAPSSSVPGSVPLVVLSSVASSSFAMSSILVSSVVTHPLCLPVLSTPWTVVSSGSSSSSVVWSLPSVVSLVPSAAHVLSVPSQSFSQPWCASVPSVSFSAPLLPPSSLAFQSSASSFFRALPSSSFTTAVSVPSLDASSAVGFSSAVEGSGASSARVSGNLDPELADPACVFTDPLEFCDGNEWLPRRKTWIPWGSLILTSPVMRSSP